MAIIIKIILSANYFLYILYYKNTSETYNLYLEYEKIHEKKTLKATLLLFVYFSLNIAFMWYYGMKDNNNNNVT